MNYTLEDFYIEANISDYPEFSKDVILRHPVKHTPIQPYWYQITGLNLTMSFDNLRAALYDDMGSGKTLVSQAFAAWHAGSGNKVVVLMPRVLFKQYKNSFDSGLNGIANHLNMEIYHCGKVQRTKKIKKWSEDGCPDLVLTTYETFRAEWVAFQALGFEVLIMDEAKFLSNPESKVSTAVDAFMGEMGSKAALVMNGTPSKNNLTNLYGNIKFITPWVYRSRVQFNIKHVNFIDIPIKYKDNHGREKIRDVKIVDSFRNLEELYCNLYLQARRVEKAEALPDLPKKEIIDFQLELSPKHYKLYKQLVDEKLIIFEDNTLIDATHASAARNMCRQAVIHTDLLQLNEESAIFEAIDSLFESIEVQENKVFLFAHYQKTVEKIVERYKKLNPAVIYGKTRNPEREKDRFLTDPDCRILVANYQAGGVGLDLQDVCHHGIAVEPTTVPGEFEQTVDRLHRGGQEFVVKIYCLIPDGTIFVKHSKDRKDKKLQIDSVVSRDSLRAELLGA